MTSFVKSNPDKSKRSVAAFLICLLLLVFTFPLYAQEAGCGDGATECLGVRPVEYLVNDIDALEKPYNYVIGETKYWLLEVIGALAIIGAIGFGLLHGFGRFVAKKKHPVTLEKDHSVYIYNIIIRWGHWFNAIAVITLLISGFWMHYVNVSHTVGYVHNMAGRAFIVFWLLFFIHELVTGDIKQYLVRGWELKGGIFRQAMFYAIGIFKQEEHPYHMAPEARLNPLQKVAYFGIMFGLAPLVGFTGLLLLEPAMMSPIVELFGMENMNIVFIIHLASAFGMAAYLFGHLYLATTGDKVTQHYKVMITGEHDEYERQTS